MSGKMFSRAALWLLSTFLVACAAQRPITVPEILVSPQDLREYRYLELDNALKVVLVSDPDADKSAAALRVNAGAGDDPLHRQGLAHFLEHMLFMGTEKYPDIEEHMKFIRTHGGSPNAFTATDNTSYFFDIDPDYLDPALDRFAQFFIAPLFDREYVDREMHAVESEYSLRIQDDARRELDVFREIIRQDHPRAKLGIGNLNTLQGGETDIREDLLAFYDAHYSSNLMTLVVFGREDLDALQAMVQHFAQVPNRRRQEQKESPPLFEPGRLPIQITIEPVEEKRELSLLFPMPSVREHWRTKPLNYIGDLLGHEGPGSLLSVLKRLGWAEALGVSAGGTLYGQSQFELQIVLSEQGLAHYRQIVGLTFETIETVRQSGIDAWRFNEQSKLAGIGFRFLEKGSPIGKVLGLASAAQIYPVAELNRGAFVLSDYNRELIRDYLSYLRPDNMLLSLVQPDPDTNQVSKWYYAPYRVDPLDTETIAGWNDPSLAKELRLPVANPYIPLDVDIKPSFDGNPLVPERIIAEPGFHVWYRQDDVFEVPRALRLIRVFTPEAAASVSQAVLNRLYLTMVSDELNETTYYAHLAGLHFGVLANSRGFDIRIAGYNDRQQVLLDRILAVLQAPELDAARFNNIKADLERALANASKDEPVNQLIRQVSPMLFQPRWNEEELLDALRPVSHQQLRDYGAGLLAEARVEALIFGNVTPMEADNFASHLRSGFASQWSRSWHDLQPLAVAILPPGGALTLELQVDHPDSAYALFVQAPNDDYATRADVLLAEQILGPSFFEDLRTRQQLGYMVGAFSFPLYRVPGLALYIQSPNSTPQGLNEAVQRFLNDLSVELEGMGAAEFEDHRNSVMLKLLERPRNLSEQGNRYHADLLRRHLHFSDKEQLAEAVAAIDIEQWRKFFTDFVQGEQRRTLTLITAGRKTGGGLPEGAVPVGSAAEFRRSATFREFASDLDALN